MDIVLDCSCGMAGDMFLASLFDAGLDQKQFARKIKSLIPGEIDFKIFRENRCGISAVRFEVISPCLNQKDNHHHHHHGHDHHHHEHEHHHHNDKTEIKKPVEHHHRGFTEIKELILASDLSKKVKEKAVSMFLELATVEAKAHGVDIESVHFHEVGAIDSIVDIVGAVLAVEMLGIKNIYVTEIALGQGQVKAAHGVMPVPAPATSELISDSSLVFRFGPEDKELLTPTGALILKTFAKNIPENYDFKVVKTGYGAGFLDFKTRPNIVKVLFAESQTKAKYDYAGKVCVLEANIDDMPSFLCQNLMDKLLAKGALDVFFTNIIMKKNRPAITLSVICAQADRVAMEEIIFAESTTIGLRFCFCERTELLREIVKVTTKYGDIRIKVSKRDEVVYNKMPEYEDCAKAAKKHGVSLKEMYLAVYAVI